MVDRKIPYALVATCSVYLDGAVVWSHPHSRIHNARNANSLLKCGAHSRWALLRIPPLLLRRFKSFPEIQRTKDEWAEEGRPLIKKATFKAVGIRVEIFRIYDICAEASHFTCDFEVFMEWCDPEIVGIEATDESKVPGGRNNAGCFDPQGGWRPKWTPHLLFHNQYDRLATWCKKYHVVDRDTGKVSAKLGYRGQFYDVMDMKMFPFDRQVLHVVIASEHPLMEMEYVQHPTGKKDTMLYENLAEWDLYNPRKANLLRPQAYHDILGDHNVGFQRYIVQIRVERRYMYFVYNVFTPIFFMALLTATTWSINPTISGERIAATFTLLLSLIAFKFAIAQHMPLVPYLTYLDQYMIMAFLSIVSVAIENAVCAQISDDPWQDQPTTRQLTFDRYFFSIFIGVWIGGNVVLLVIAMKGKLFERWDDIEDNDETRTIQAHPDDGEGDPDDPNRSTGGDAKNPESRGAHGSPPKRTGSLFSKHATATSAVSKLSLGGKRRSTAAAPAGSNLGAGRRSNSNSTLQKTKGSIIGATR